MALCHNILGYWRDFSQPHTLLCIKFLDKEDYDVIFGTVTLLRVVWGYVEIQPVISSEWRVVFIIGGKPQNIYMLDKREKHLV